MKRKHLVLGIAAALAILAGVLIFANRRTTSHPSFKVGMLLPQTGPGASFADYLKKGADLAVGDINAREPRAIELVYGDSKNEPREGVTVFRQMVLTEKPPVVITALSSVTKAVAPLAKDNGTVVIGTAVGLPNVTAPSEFVFRVYPEANGLAGVIAGYAAEHYKTAAVVYINDDFGISGSKVFRQVFESKGGKVLTAEPYNITETDFRNQWAKINSQSPECVWITGYGPAYAVIVRQMRESGSSAALLADMTLGLPVTLKNVGGSAEGVVYVDGRMAPEFVAKYRAKYGDDPTSYAGYAYDIIGMLNVARREGATSADQVRSRLSHIQGYDGAMGKITIAPNRDASLTFVLMEIKGGQPARLGD